MLSSLRAASESIHFQSGSPFAREIIPVFQEAIDFRDRLDYAKIPEEGRREYRVNKVRQYVKQTTLPKFARIVEKYTGVQVGRTTILEDEPANTIFTMETSFDDMEDAVQIDLQFTGREPVSSDNLSRVLKEMMSMADLFDPVTGKVSSSTYGKNNRRVIRTHLFFDVNTAFLSLDTFPVEVAGDPLTAEEIAALLMHETGLVMTFVEHAGDVYARTKRNLAHLMDIVKNQDPTKSLSEIIEFGRPYIIKAAEDGLLPKPLAESVKQSLDTWKELIDEESESFWSTIKGAHWLFVITFMMIFLYMIGYIFFLTALQQNLMILNKELLYLNQGSKTSDQLFSAHNWYFCSQHADEYVARQGLAGALAGALKKIEHYRSIMKTGTYGVIFSSRLRKSRIINWYIKLMIFTQTWFTPSFEPLLTEELRARLTQLARSVLAVFKNDLTKTELAFYLGEYERVQAELSTARGGKLGSLVRTLQDYFNIFALPAKLTSSLATGRLPADYEKMQKQMEALIDNQLYYFGAKFKHLSSMK